jgi:hypothetical protein
MFFFDDVYQGMSGLRGTMLGALGILLLIIATLCGLSFVLIKVVFKKQIANFESKHQIGGGILKNFLSF